MIIGWRQRLGDGVIRDDRELIGDFEAEFDALVDLKTSEHDAGADKELVSAGALAARPLRVVEGELGPEIFAEMILEGRAADERCADRVQIVSRQRVAYRRLNVEVAPAYASGQRGSDDPGRPVGESGDSCCA